MFVLDGVVVWIDVICHCDSCLRPGERQWMSMFSGGSWRRRIPAACARQCAHRLSCIVSELI